MNKKIKTLLSTLVVINISSNIAFAEIMTVSKPTVAESTTQYKGTALEIIKAQGTTVTSTIENFSGKFHSTGHKDNGSKGVTIGAAYLNPDKKFGYVYVENYDYDGRGVVKRYCDQAGTGTSWGGDPNRGSISDSNNRLYENAKSYFVSTSGPAYKSISSVTKEKLASGSYNIQTDDKGKTFVASTFYVRYTYDIDDGNVRAKKYESSNPILNDDFTSGPYVGMGDYFDETMDVVDNSNYKGIIQNNSKYLKSLSSLGISIPSGVIGLTIDDGFIPKNGSYRRATKKAVLEKRYEYRRYVESSTTTVTNPGGFEVVYPLKNVTTKTQSILPDVSPKVSISATTEYTNSLKTSIRRYLLNINISTKKQTNYYNSNLQTYVVRKEADRPTTEPTENNMDFWHSNATATLDIVDSSGTSRLYNVKPVYITTKQLYIYPSDIKPDYSGSRSLDNCTAVLTLNFKNNARYLARKELYSYRYQQNNSEKTYNQVISYISTKETGLQVTTNIENYQKSTDPREELTYKTQTSKTLSVQASAGISAVVAGDYANADVVVSVDPPNTLTVLEGASFTVNIDISTNGVPVGDDGSDTWISDFKIDEVLITSAQGDTVYKENDIYINPSSPVTVIKHQIKDLTAKPSHIGKATVKVNYSYTINRRTYTVEPVAGSGREDEDGNMEWDYEVVTHIDQTYQNGSGTNYFNIFSITGNTVS